MDAWRLVVVVVLGALFALAAVGNATILVGWLWRRSRASIVPFVGGLSGMLAMLVGGNIRWCWLPLVLDAGSALPAIGLAYMLCTRRRDQ